MKKFITFLSIVTALMCNVTYGVKAESVNVIKNGDFSSYEKGSTSYQKNDKYTDYGIWYSSASAELFETPSGSANGCAGKVRATRLGQKIKLESGITYTLSFTYRSYSEGSANDADFGLFKYDTAEKVDYNNDENLIKDTLKTSSATFANYTKTFTCQETGDYALMFWNFTGGSGGTDTVYVDDVAITYETVPVITYEKLTSVNGDDNSIADVFYATLDTNGNSVNGVDVTVNGLTQTLNTAITDGTVNFAVIVGYANGASNGYTPTFEIK